MKKTKVENVIRVFIALPDVSGLGVPPGADQLLQSTPQCLHRCCWAVPGWQSHDIACPWVCQALSTQVLLCTPGSKDFIIKEGKIIHEETEEKQN